MIKDIAQKRVEVDSLGSVDIDVSALYGIATERAVRHSSIGANRVPSEFIKALGLVKYACASANEALGLLPKEKAKMIQKVAWMIYNGELLDNFPIEIFQTGGCTPTNMNVNEVIANYAAKERNMPIGQKNPLHPNDDCNLGQSTNDVTPTAINIAAYLLITNHLLPALNEFRDRLVEKEKAWSEIKKVGRTHTMDAVLMTLGEEFSAYRRQVEQNIARFNGAISSLLEVPLGGTAVGNGLNTHPQFGERAVETINNVLGTEFVVAKNRFEKQSSRDDYVALAGLIDALATTLIKIANDIRWLGSGPVCGLNELIIPATQEGSSCMPSKINPVVCETLIQSAIYAQGNCEMIRKCAVIGGQFQLNTTTSLIIHSLITSMKFLPSTLNIFVNSLLINLKPNLAKLTYNVENSYALATTLIPVIGYDQATSVTQKAICENVPVKNIIPHNGSDN